MQRTACCRTGVRGWRRVRCVVCVLAVTRQRTSGRDTGGREMADSGQIDGWIMTDCDDEACARYLFAIAAARQRGPRGALLTTALLHCCWAAGARMRSSRRVAWAGRDWPSALLDPRRQTRPKSPVFWLALAGFGCRRLGRGQDGLRKRFDACHTCFTYCVRRARASHRPAGVSTLYHQRTRRRSFEE